MSKAQILIVEDDRSLADVLDYNLRQDGYQTVVSNDGQDGLRQAKLRTPDLIVLDLMLPLVDGLQICRRLRADPVTRNILVLMLTAKTEETDEVVGFNIGADDYVAKPFRTRPLIERVKALVRRRPTGEPDADTLSMGGLDIDRTRHSVKLNGRELAVTPTEFKLLWTLLRQPGRAFNRHELLDCCRGGDANSMERTIDVHVRALRKKLGREGDVIETVRGVGYRCKSLSSSG
jgi:two-component system phosphate regulon response regulator PhoB